MPISPSTRNNPADPGRAPYLELLAPAGDMAKLAMAIQYGADAVYLGLQAFSLRAQAGNFSLAQLREALALARGQGVKVYVTLNMIAHPADLAGLRPALRELAGLAPDALIIADPGVFMLARQEAPDLPVHISTQANVTNAASCQFWYDQGVRRIVLARELSLSEISAIRREIPADLELEGFVHGAMCMAYSGRCLLSNVLTGRGANQGQCAQPCRWSYQIIEPGASAVNRPGASEARQTGSSDVVQPVMADDASSGLAALELHEVKRPDQPLRLEQDSRGSYLFNSHDLCLIEYLPELAAAGLNSLKIEGRVKSAFYVATVVKAYREALDAFYADPDHYRCDPAWLADLRKTVHRPFDTGFYFQSPQQSAKICLTEAQVREAAVVGLVLSFLPDSGLALVEQRNRILAGEKLELVQPDGRHTDLLAAGLLDLDRRPIQATPHPRMYYFLPVPHPVQPGSFLRRLGDKDQPRRQA